MGDRDFSEIPKAQEHFIRSLANLADCLCANGSQLGANALCKFDIVNQRIVR
jgi:hypothetical protein